MENKTFVAYRDNTNNRWFTYFNDKPYWVPFGYYVLEFCNNCSEMSQGKEIYVNNTFYKISNSKNPDIELARRLELVDENTMTVTKEKISAYYDKFISDKGMVWFPEYELMLKYLLNIDEFTGRKTSMQDLNGIYTHFKYFATSVSSNHYEPDRLKRNKYIDKQYHEIVIYKGGSVVLFENDYVATECFEFQGMYNIFILDLWEFLFNPACRRQKILKCKNCENLFCSNNNQAKYCDICKHPDTMGKIRYENRKRNTVRKLHHDIVTKLYSSGNRKTKSPNEFSNAFLEESNYYWDIVQGKKVAHNPLYHEHIKTETQYREWLEKKLNSL